jgi:hypothetical protein
MTDRKPAANRVLASLPENLILAEDQWMDRDASRPLQSAMRRRNVL